MNLSLATLPIALLFLAFVLNNFRLVICRALHPSCFENISEHADGEWPRASRRT